MQKLTVFPLDLCWMTTNTGLEHLQQLRSAKGIVNSRQTLFYLIILIFFLI